MLVSFDHWGFDWVMVLYVNKSLFMSFFVGIKLILCTLSDWTNNSKLVESVSVIIINSEFCGPEFKCKSLENIRMEIRFWNYGQFLSIVTIETFPMQLGNK